MRIDNHMGGFRTLTKLPVKKIRKSAIRRSEPQMPDKANPKLLNSGRDRDAFILQGKKPSLYRHTRLQKAASELASKGVL